MKQLFVTLLLGLLLVTPAHAAQRNLIVTASNAQAQKRVALVIGNAAYQGAPALRNPVNDAKAISDALNKLGFEVIEVTNATQKEMLRAITVFGNKLNAETAALFFYAGHGMQVRGKNFIIPVDAQIESESAVASESVSVDTVLEQLNASPVSIVILDACRNNPFERSFRKIGGGLAQIDAPKGSFIAYATAPGKTAADGDGKHGLFTQELLKQINEPGVELAKLFMRVRANVAAKSSDAQMPWDSSSMVGEFYFKPTQVASLEPVPSPTGGSVSLDDIKKQQETRGQWNKWQAGMKVDFDKISALNVAPELQVAAWDRFLANYSQKNPYSSEDKQLRAQAQSKMQAAQAQQQEAAQLEQQKHEAELTKIQSENHRLVDINSSQKDALITLLGISDADADKIIAGRPYGSKTWLLSHNILTDQTYNAVKDKIRCMVTKKDIDKIMENERLGKSLR
jgi:uncharacterized caspase-like protein